MTSDNISPLHLMDTERVAFETRPVTVVAEPPVQSFPVQSARRRERNRQLSRGSILSKEGAKERRLPPSSTDSWPPVDNLPQRRRRSMRRAQSPQESKRPSKRPRLMVKTRPLRRSRQVRLY